MTAKQYISREKYVAALNLSIQSEKKGDELTKLGRPELAAREYAKSIKIEESLLGKSHPLVEKLRSKLTAKKGWTKTAQRNEMNALEQSFKHEKRGDYLVKTGQKDSAIREYTASLKIEMTIMGKEHPVVTSLVQKVILATETNIAADVMKSEKKQQENSVESSQKISQSAVPPSTVEECANQGTLSVKATKTNIVLKSGEPKSAGMLCKRSLFPLRQKAVIPMAA
jgi:hypothetical protein